MKVYKPIFIPLFDNKLLEELLLLKGVGIGEVVSSNAPTHYVFDRILNEEDPIFIVMCEIVLLRLKSGLGIMCARASILFVMLAEKRVPHVFQVLHLEWVCRIFQGASRLVFRYLKNFLAIPSVIKSL